MVNRKGQETGRLGAVVQSARSIDRLLSNGKMTVREAAKLVGVSTATISQRARIARCLPEWFLSHLESGQGSVLNASISERRLKQLSKLSKDELKVALEKIILPTKGGPPTDRAIRR